MVDLAASARAAFHGFEHNPAVWVVLPSYSLATFRAASLAPQAVRRRLLDWSVSGRSTHGLEVRTRARTVYVSATENQRRVLAPLWEDAAVERCIGVTRVWPGAGNRRVARVASSRFRNEGASPGSVLLRLEHADRLVDVARRVLRHARARVLVTANQHSIPTRAFLWAARELGVTSVYIAHAPMADNAAYRDLPVRVAGLRGQREVERYLEIGSRGDGLVAIGNPAIDLDLRTPAPAGPVVFALSPHPPDVLRPLVAMVHEAAGDDVVIAPHPAMRIDDLRTMIPGSWRLHDGPSQVLLREGATCVIQHSSGIAWEALALGIPVVELSFPGVAALYDFIAAPFVARAESSAELADAIELARHRRDGRARQAWARSWCTATGEEAAAAGRRIVTDAADLDAAWLLDAWG